MKNNKMTFVIKEELPVPHKVPDVIGAPFATPGVYYAHIGSESHHDLETLDRLPSAENHQGIPSHLTTKEMRDTLLRTYGCLTDTDIVTTNSQGSSRWNSRHEQQLLLSEIRVLEKMKQQER